LFLLTVSTLALCLLACGDDTGNGGNATATSGNTDDTGTSPTPDADSGTSDDTMSPDAEDSAGVPDGGATAEDSSAPGDTMDDSTELTDGDTGDGQSGTDSTDVQVPDDTGGTTEDGDPGIPNAELLLKVIGPPLQSTGKSHVAVQGAVTPLTGLILGGADSITWTSITTGESGEAGGSPFWQTGGISLSPGTNVITVTATKGSETASDTVTITYNPGFLFDAPPRISPDMMFVGEPTNAVITVPITLYSSFNPSTVKAWLVDAEGNKTSNQALASLVDNGNLSKCDEVEEDGVFSACLSGLSCNSADDIFVSISTDIDSDTATYTAWSAPIRIECADRIPVSSCTEAQGGLAAARLKWTESGGENDPVAARDAAIDWLKQQSYVADAGPAAGDGYGVWVEFNGGFLGAINLSPAGMRAGSGAAMAAAQAVEELAQAQNSPFNIKTITSKKALVMAPFNNELTSNGGDEASHIANALQSSGCPTFAVHSNGMLTHAAVDLMTLRRQYLYGVIALTGHGDAYFRDMSPTTKQSMGIEHMGSQEVLWTGEQATCNNLTSTNKSCGYTLVDDPDNPGQPVVDNSSCPTGTECVITGASGASLTGRCIDKTQMDLRKGRVILSDQNWGVTGQFSSRHAQRQFPNSLVYLGTCRSLYNGTQAAEYIAAGAKSVAGYGDYVHNAFALESGQSFFDAMLVENEYTGGAFFAAHDEDPNFSGSYFRMLGAMNLDIMNADLINPSFETGDLTGWNRDGDGRVISKLGITIPVHGKFMGLVSTGLGFTVQTGEISQNFCIPGDKTQLQFYWKFFSEEFKEWCGSQFQDTFEAKLSNDVGQLTMVNAKVDDLCHYNDGSCASCPDPGIGNCECGTQYVGLIPSDISFDQGGVYNIQWQLAEQDVTPLAGQGPVELKFFSTDQGDSIYDTVILFDSVVFK
jgi:hypothetical protein